MYLRPLPKNGCPYSIYMWLTTRPHAGASEAGVPVSSGGSGRSAPAHSPFLHTCLAPEAHGDELWRQTMSWGLIHAQLLEPVTGKAMSMTLRKCSRAQMPVMEPDPEFIC